MKQIYPLSGAKDTVLIQPHNIYGGIKHVYEHKNIPLISVMLCETFNVRVY